jgi:hydroxypyruvate isomerase
MPKLAANLSMLFTEVSFLDRFEAAAACGFHAVEFLFPYEHPATEIRSRLDRFGLQQVLFNLPPGDWAAGDRGMAIFPERRDEFQRSLDLALGYAAEVGCPRLHVMAGIVPADASPQQARACYVESLAIAAAAAGSRGVTVLIEPLNTRDMPGYFLTRVDDALAIIAEVGSPHLELQLDLYHRQIMGGDLAETIRRTLPKVGHVQIAGVPGRHEPDVGEIAYDYLFDVLDAAGYGGWIGCEYRPRGATVAGLGWAAPYGIVGGEAG